MRPAGAPPARRRPPERSLRPWAGLSWKYACHSLWQDWVRSLPEARALALAISPFPGSVAANFVPDLFSSSGMVLAGKLLDHVQFWPVFQECPELFILVPALLGLKVRVWPPSTSGPAASSRRSVDRIAWKMAGWLHMEIFSTFRATWK